MLTTGPREPVGPGKAAVIERIARANTEPEECAKWIHSVHYHRPFGGSL